MKIRAFNIIYDTDGDAELAKLLPKELILDFDEIDENNFETIITDRISDETGFCIFSCQYEILPIALDNY